MRLRLSRVLRGVTNADIRFGHHDRMLYATDVTEGTVAGGTSGASVAVNFTEAFDVVPTLHLGFEFR
jgi:hypothetical protein